MRSVDENTPLRLAEAGRVGAPDDDVEVRGRESWFGRWKPSRGAAALTVTLLALGACVASAVTAANAPFDAVSLGARRNHVHRVGDDLMPTRSARGHKRGVAKDRSHKTRRRGRRHVPRLGAHPSLDDEIDVIELGDVSAEVEMQGSEAPSVAPEPAPQDEAFEAPEPAPEMDPFDVTAVAEAPEPAKLPEESVEAREPAEAMATVEEALAPEPAPQDAPVESVEAPEPAPQDAPVEPAEAPEPAEAVATVEEALAPELPAPQDPPVEPAQPVEPAPQDAPVEPAQPVEPAPQDAPVEPAQPAEVIATPEQPSPQDAPVETPEPTEEVSADVSEAPEATETDPGTLGFSGQTTEVASGTLGDLPSNPYPMKPCPNAFFPPRKTGSVEESRVSVTMEGVLKYADKVYILCTSDCDDIVVPTGLNDRVTMVDGLALDDCNGFGSETKHWEKASQSHRAAMLDAFRDPDVNILAILEQDTLGDPDVVWEQEKWYELEGALANEDWNLVRLAYRPYDFEPGREGGETCPSECECEVYSSHMCLVRNAGCALQSSDAYFIHRRAHAQAEESLSQGKVIDYHTFKEIGGHFLVTPALTYQQSFSYGPDFITQDSMKQTIDKFLGFCTRFEYFASDSR